MHVVFSSETENACTVGEWEFVFDGAGSFTCSITE